MFQAFRRFHPDVAKGEGVGLTLVHRIIGRHRGKIRFESTEGEGTIFFVALPTSPPKDNHGEAPGSDGPR
jgi:signal transduction histidine kinase